MKVLQFMPEFGLAGAERMAEDLILGLVERGVEVEVASFYDYHSSITENLEDNGIKIHYLGKTKGADFSLIPRIRRLLNAIQPDILHTHRYCLKYVVPAITGLRNSTNQRIHAVHTVHNMAEKEVAPHQIPMHRIFFRTKRVVPVAISPQVRASVMKLYSLKQEDIPLVYNGVDREIPCIEKSGDEFTFLHIGRYEDVKNHAMLVDSFESVYKERLDARLVLLGEGELYDDIKQHIDERGLSSVIDQVGRVDDVCAYLAKADAFVLASKYEGFPISLIEAFNAGLPCICTSVGGIPDIVSGGENGVLCDCRADSLALAMLKVMNDDALRDRIGREALKSSAQYSRSAMCEGYLNIYKDLMNCE